MDNIQDPDDKRLFHLFRQCGMDEDGAYTAIQEVRSMAGQNVIAEVRAQGERQSGDLKELRADLSGRLNELRADQSGDTKELRAEVRNTYRTIGYLITAVGGVLAFMLIVIRLLE